MNGPGARRDNSDVAQRSSPDYDSIATIWNSARVGEVSFYLPEQRALQGRDPAALDCERDWEVFGTGMYVWILQTFLRLRDAGAPVRLSRTPPPAGVVVTHADYVERLLAEAPAAAALTVVSARADRRRQIYADVEIVQNAASVEDFQIFIPSWLQPGLIPRTPERGARLENVAFVGARKQLHADLGSDDWIDALRDRGLRWELRTVTYGSNDQVYSQHRWNDYSTSDVIVALRPPDMWEDASKPAAKLANAWAAGVPAILSPEVPYRELRRSNLDYLEARTAAEALAAIDQLRHDPGLYAAMVANGAARARDFAADRITQYWAEALWRTVPAWTSSPLHRLAARVRGYRASARLARYRLRRLHPATQPGRAGQSPP